MKRALLPILLAFPVISAMACSSEDNPVTVPGGAGTSVGTAGTAGTAPAGGSTGTSGSGTSAGTANMTGGTGTGGAAAGSGGMSGSTSTGGAMGGSGGSAGTGTGGAMGGTGGSAETPVSVGKLDGMLITTPCDGTSSSDDCKGSGWIYEGKTYGCVGPTLDSDAGANKTILDFPVTGGVRGKRYMANMHFYGIMEPKDYGPMVTRQFGAMRPSQTAIPATPEPFATANAGVVATVTEYNNYELHSFDENGQEIKQYFINSDTGQGHYTFAISYAREIEVVSGGKVHVRYFDSNCRMIKNCLGGAPCAGKARSIDLTGASPMPVGLMQPGLGNDAAQAGQWFFIDVKTIVPKP